MNASDTADYSTSSSAVWVDLTTGVGHGGDADGDQLTSIEKIIGSRHDDRLSGSEARDLLKGQGGDDLLFGAGGNDRLIGGGGDDMLLGGTGNDILIGGKGTDTFVFNADEGRDKISDFEIGVDLISFGAGISFDDLNIQDHAQGSRITVDGTTIIVVGVDAANLDIYQFSFGHDESAFT